MLELGSANKILASEGSSERTTGHEARLPRLRPAGTLRLHPLVPLPIRVRHEGLKLPETIED